MAKYLFTVEGHPTPFHVHVTGKENGLWSATISGWPNRRISRDAASASTEPGGMIHRNFADTSESGVLHQLTSWVYENLGHASPLTPDNTV